MQVELEDTQNLEIFINNEITERGAQELANLYNNFISNRRKISNRITRFLNRAVAKNVLEVHCDNHNYTLVNPDLDFYKRGYKIINDIRVLLGLEPTVYNIGILDETEGKAYEVQLLEKEFLKYMRTRGKDKAALSHSLDTVNDLLKKSENNKGKDITDSFVNKFLPIIKKKTEEDNFDLNYGYAFEAYGHIKQADNTKENRHDIYYNYYRESRKNNEAWVTGGDIGNLQYKLIRIYENNEGQKVISSASITSGNTIIKEMNNLKEMLNNSELLSSAEISYILAKHFTQLNIPKNLTKTIEKKIGEAIEPYLLSI